MASDHANSARRLLVDLGACGARCALVGGFAFSVRVKPRSTKDVDFAVVVADDREAEQLVRALLLRGYRHGALLETEAGRLATVRLFLPGSPSREPEAVLLFATCGIEPEIVANATQLQIDGVGKVAVARVGHLIAMKCLSESDRRQQDRVDLQELVEIADRRELALARAGVRRIAQRGFARGKDLHAVLQRFLAARPRRRR